MKRIFLTALLFFLIFPAFCYEETIQLPVEELMPEKISENFAGTSVEIRTSKKYSSVYLNGEYKGTAPVIVNGLIPGKYELKVEKTGFEPQRKIIKVSGNTSYIYYIVFK